MRTFGDIGYTTDRISIKGKLSNRASKVMFVGYADEHDGDCYRLFKFDTGQVILSQDVRWDDQPLLGLTSTFKPSKTDAWKKDDEHPNGVLQG